MTNQNELFAAGLGLQKPWKVINSVLEQCSVESRILCVDIDFEADSRFACPQCGKSCAVYDSEVKRWRHMNFWQHATYLSARIPRTNCPEHGILQITAPWARKGSGFTLMFEASLMALVREMPVKAVSEMVGEHDTLIWRVVRFYVDHAHSKQDWSGVEAVAIDETATRKGHRYATVVVETDPDRNAPARLLFMTPDRTASCVEEFVNSMPSHEACPEQVKLAAIDMSPAYQRGVLEHLPGAEIVFDRFHVMKLAGEAVDRVRKQLRSRGEDLKGAMWALRGNEENLSEDHLKLRRKLCAKHRELGRALALKESLQETWEYAGPYSARAHLKAWCSWARRSRLERFKKLALTIRAHWDGILGYFPHRITSAAIEAINGIIQTARRRARGYRNFANLRTIAYWMAGHLDIEIGSPFTHPI